MMSRPRAIAPQKTATHQPGLFVSCRRRTASARPGMTVARFHMAGEEVQACRPWRSPSRDSRALMLTAASVHHQNSLREARPLNTVYFCQKRRKASGEGASVVRLIQRHSGSGRGVLAVRRRNRAVRIAIGGRCAVRRCGLTVGVGVGRGLTCRSVRPGHKSSRSEQADRMPAVRKRAAPAVRAAPGPVRHTAVRD